MPSTDRRAKIQGLNQLPPGSLKKLPAGSLHKLFKSDGVDDLDRGIHDMDLGVSYRRPLATHTHLNLAHVHRAVDHLGELPAPGETAHYIVSGLYPLWSVVPAVIQLGGKITNLYILTLSFSRDNISELLSLLDAGRIDHATLIASHYFAHAKINAHIYDPAKIGLESRGHRCHAMRSHCKLILMELADGRAFTAEGSANLRSCKNLENYCLTQHRGLYEFNREWIEKLLEKRKK